MATLSEPLQRIPASEYFSAVALSNSGMKDLSVSPLYYWYRNINPDRPIVEATEEQQFGTALHCLVLEGRDAFDERFVQKIDAVDHPGCLVNVDHIKAWITDRGKQPKGKVKADFIAQAKLIDPDVVIWDEIIDKFKEDSFLKTIIDKDDWRRLHGCAEALSDEPLVQKILAAGESEVSIFGSDPDTTIPLKMRLDWVGPQGILDLKTFTRRRGKSIDQCVADAIYYETYYRQAFLYATGYQRAARSNKLPRFVFAFVESDPPHEVRLREIRQSSHGTTNMYWQKAQIEVRHFCSLWGECMREFGDQPWRVEQKIEVLLDEDMRGMAFA